MNKITPVGLGHNSGVLVDPEILREQHADLVERQEKMLAAFDRAPTTVADSETDAKMSDFVAQFLAVKKMAESSHKTTKEPFLTAGRAVDSFFKGIADKMDACVKSIRQRQTEYKLRLEAEQRRRLAEEAARLADEKRRAEEAAAKQRDAIDLEDVGAVLRAEESARVAKGIAVQAKEAKEATQVKAAELTRARGDYGSVSSLRSEWKGEVSDRAALDLEALRPHISEDALNQAIRSYVKVHAPKGNDATETFPAPLKGARIWLHKFTR